jgi:SAM-dependent methyltransferase
MTVFGTDYADAYDAIYRAKDYDGEVGLIERILHRHGLDGPRRLLDLGCGTGNHALRLAGRGHAVVGIDRSPAMLAKARAKASAAPTALAVEFQQGDIRNIDLGRRFDAVLMMFTVLGYQLDDDDLNGALAAARRHLEGGGLYVFDVWNGLAVLAEPPRERSISVNEGTSKITRYTRPFLDLPRNICHICFDLQRVEADGRTEEWQEEHVMRYYFPDELERALRRNRFGLLSLRCFPDDEAPADERAWNVVGVAQAE